MSAAREAAASAPASASTSASASGGRAPAGAARPDAGRLLLPALAGLALVAGYADLVRGGITLGPVLLVLAYCVLIPVAILLRR